MASAAPSLTRMPVLADLVAGIRAPTPTVAARNAVLVLGGALLTALLAQVSLPVPGSPVPITGQTLAVVLTAASLGPWRGVAGQGLYLLLGVIGLPFYSDGSSGVHVLAGATGGYLLGFLPAAVLIGAAARRGRDRHIASATALFIAGQGVIFAVGVPWLAVVAHLDTQQAIAAGLTPFLVGGLVKAGIAGLLLPGSWRLVNHRDH